MNTSLGEAFGSLPPNLLHGGFVKLYTWTRVKPLRDGDRTINKGDTVGLSDARAEILAEFIKPVKEVKEPKGPKAPEGVPTGKIQDRVAELKKG